MDGLEFKSKINVWANAKQIQNQTKTSKKRNEPEKIYRSCVEVMRDNLRSATKLIQFIYERTHSDCAALRHSELIVLRKWLMYLEQ